MRTVFSLCALALLAGLAAAAEPPAGTVVRALDDGRLYELGADGKFRPAVPAPMPATKAPAALPPSVTGCPSCANGTCAPAGPSGCAPAAEDALAAVNAKRAARGLAPFARDPLLAEAARRAAAFRAEHRLFGHTGNDFAFVPAGARAASAGCAAYPASYGFMACCVYENYTFAGAASVVGPDGRVYHHLFVR